jgi:hypothetical protein
MSSGAPEADEAADDREEGSVDLDSAVVADGDQSPDGFPIGVVSPRGATISVRRLPGWHDPWVHDKLLVDGGVVGSVRQ